MVATPRIFQLDGEDKKSKCDEDEASWQSHRNGKLHKSEDYWARDIGGPAYAASAGELRLSTQGTGKLHSCQSCVRRETDAVKPEPMYSTNEVRTAMTECEPPRTRNLEEHDHEVITAMTKQLACHAPLSQQLLYQRGEQIQ